MKMIVRKTSFFAVLAVTLILGTVSENASAGCSVVKSAHCFCSGGGATFTNTSPECYNQQTQNDACAADCLGACNQKGTFYNSIKAARTGAGACGDVSVQINGHAGTRSDTSKGSCIVSTGGSWIAPVPAQCPQGGTLSGSNCVISAPITKTCPAGWMANPTNEVAGVTTDGLCKRQVPGCQLTAPVPANGTQIAGYGFTWGNGVYQMSNASNGGLPANSCPRGFSISGNNCVKSYPAIPAVAGYCKR